MSRKGSFFGTLLVIMSVVALFIGFIYAKNWYYKRKHNEAIVAWKGTAYEWVEKFDSAFVLKPEEYVEIEGILMNFATTQGATTIYFTSGLQTDTAYLVGQQVDWPALAKQSKRTACDSLIFMYGKNFNLQTAPIQVMFSGDVVNSDSDDLLQFSYFETCHYTKGKSHFYRLQDFCAQKVNVRARIQKVQVSNGMLEVELDEVMVLSKEKNKIKFQ